jgi:hypothetical protein
VIEGKEKEFDLERLETLAKTLIATRKLAIEGRKQSGIEEIWREDEEHYEGIDDLNRGDNSVTSKPPNNTAVASSENACTKFFNITRPYVDAAAAKVGDILLPTDERAWSLGPTPVPELIEVVKGEMPAEIQGALAQRGMPPEQIAQEEQQAKANAQAKVEEAKKKAEGAEKQIEDWHIEGQWHAEMRKVIDDTCRLGSGVLKGPVPRLKKCAAWIRQSLQIKEEIKPVSTRVDPWNFFPDPGCGESIHNGGFTWEVDRFTPRMLEELKDDENYIGAQIQACLDEKPKNILEPRKTTDGKPLSEKDLFEVWYYYGFVKPEDLEAAGCECPEGEDGETSKKSIPAILTLVNDRVIKAVLNPLDTGDFPYDVMPWQCRRNMPWGTGVARQIRVPQEVVNGAGRAMMTNAGRAAGPILVLKAGKVQPADGSAEITPWKQYYIEDDADMADIKEFISTITIPMLQAEMMNIIQWGMKMAEDVTGLPLLLQGQAGAAPDTLGGQQLVDRNASGVLRRIARTIDDKITEPHVRRYYTYLLQYGRDELKGEYVLDARGSSAFAEREIERQRVSQMVQASLNPAFGLDPRRTIREQLRLENKDPKDYEFTDEELKQQAESKQQEQPDPALQVAKIRSDTELNKAKMNQSSDMAELQFKAEEAEKQRQHEREMKDREEAMLDKQLQLAAIKQGQDAQASLDKNKTSLAETTMELQVQERLASADRVAAQVATPPTEPPGRAEDGKAYQQ